MSRANASGQEKPPFLGYLLKHAQMHLSAMTDAALVPFDIDSRDLGVLRVLVDRVSTSQQQAAETLRVDRTTMVALLDTLESKGIVTRRSDPSDRRRNVVELTESGLAMYRRAVDEYAAAEQAFLDPINPVAADELRDALRTVVTEHESADII